MRLPKNIVDAVANQAREEYDFSYTTIQRKRQYFRDNYPLLLNIGSENKVYERLIFRMVDMMCALSHKFAPTVTFMKRGEDDTETVKMLERVKEFDYDEMEMGWKKYRVHRYKFVFGVGIEVRDTFNANTSTPNYKVVNPLAWIPDIAFDINTGFRYHGFELECTRAELEYNKEFYNLEFVKDLETLRNERSSEQQENYLASVQNRKLNEQSSLPKGIYGIYQHFTTYEGNKYEIRLANDRTLPIYCRWIKPVLKEEKQNPALVSFGVNVRRWRPLPNDPYGVSFAFDMLADKQKQKQALHNLNMIKVKEQATGGKFIFDPELVTAENMDVLKNAFDRPVYIPVPGMSRSNNNPVQELPKNQVYPSTFDFNNVLDQITIQDTSMDERTMGVSAGPQITRAESERVQTNANIRLLLGANFDIYAEKEFYRTLRYREYVENKNKIKEKYVEITNGVNVIPVILKAQDFITKQDPRLKTVSKIDAEEKREQKRLGFIAIFNTLMQGAKSDFARNKLMKEMAELHGMDQELIDVVFSGTGAEQQARADLDLIARGIVPKVGDIMEDHETFIDIYNSSPNTETKLKAIFARELAKQMRDEMMKQQPQPQGEVVSNSIQNQALAQASNKQTPNATSLEQVI